MLLRKEEYDTSHLYGNKGLTAGIVTALRPDDQGSILSYPKAFIFSQYPDRLWSLPDQ